MGAAKGQAPLLLGAGHPGKLIAEGLFRLVHGLELLFGRKRVLVDQSQLLAAGQAPVQVGGDVGETRHRFLPPQ